MDSIFYQLRFEHNFDEVESFEIFLSSYFLTLPARRSEILPRKKNLSFQHQNIIVTRELNLLSHLF